MWYDSQPLYKKTGSAFIPFPAATVAGYEELRSI